MLRNIINEMIDKTSIRSCHRVFSTEKDKVVRVKENKNTFEFDFLKKNLGNLNSTKSKIAAMFKAKTASRFIGDRERGKINNRSLAKIATGNRRVFKEKIISRDINTAVTFLVDFSASMNESKMSAAMSAAIVFLETLDNVGIACELLGYTTDRTEQTEDCYNYGRIEGLLTYEFKNFNEPYGAKTKRMISAYKKIRKAENVDPDSLRVAYDRIVKRQEARKIIFILTDGIVSNLANNQIGKNELKRLVQNIEQQGNVEIVCVELMSWGSEEYYSNVIKVKNSNKLPEQLLGGLKKALRM